MTAPNLRQTHFWVCRGLDDVSGLWTPNAGERRPDRQSGGLPAPDFWDVPIWMCSESASSCCPKPPSSGLSQTPKLTPLSGTAEVVPAVNRGDPPPPPVPPRRRFRRPPRVPRRRRGCSDTGFSMWHASAKLSVARNRSKGKSDGFCHQDHARQHEIESEWDCQRRSKTRPCGGAKVAHFGSVRSLSP